jgi:hypothetical protein
MLDVSGVIQSLLDKVADLECQIQHLLAGRVTLGRRTRFGLGHLKAELGSLARNFTAARITFSRSSICANAVASAV